MNWSGRLAAILLICAWTSIGALAADADKAVPLELGQRTIHVFRASVGMFSAEERALAARKRIEAALEQPGEVWTSVKSTPSGVEVAIDGKPMFLVVTGDARAPAGESPEDLANAASRVLQKVWSEARERLDPRANLEAVLRTALASVLLIVASFVAMKVATYMRRRIARDLAARLGSLPGAEPPSRRRRPASLIDVTASANGRCNRAIAFTSRSVCRASNNR